MSEYLEECVGRYGDIFTLRLFGLPPLVFIANPQGIQEIFSADAKSFEVGKTNDLARPILGDRSLILMDGSRHKRERKLLMPPFHGEKVKSYAKSICKITETVTSCWQINQSFIARNVMQDITLKVIMQMSDEQLKDELITLLVAGHETTATRLAWAFYWREKYPDIKEKLTQEIESWG